ncbi:MAG: hypothetical protein Kow0098_05400 [Ignavibacteriaceae bacterium]
MKPLINLIILSKLFLIENGVLLAQDFAPIDLGNIWIWRDEFGDINKSTLTDTNYYINNKIYSRIKVYDSSDIFRYIRLDNSDSLYKRLWIPDNYESPYYKINAELGDEWSYQFGGGPSLTVRTIVAVFESTVFDTTVMVKQLHINNGGLTEFDEFWTEEFGLLSGYETWSGNMYFLLRGCVIDGKVYGDTSYPTGLENDFTPINNFVLYQNYPNPFNPTTKIDFEIKEYSPVSLKVFDLLGIEVAVLVNEEKYPGKYSVEFNGESFSSGVYFYKLTIGGNTLIRKMILLR